MIELFDGYFIQVDNAGNYSVGTTYKKIDSKTNQEEIAFNAEAHLGSLKSALRWFITNRRKEKLQKIELMTLKEAIEIIEKSDKECTKFISNTFKEIKIN